MTAATFLLDGGERGRTREKKRVFGVGRSERGLPFFRSTAAAVVIAAIAELFSERMGEMIVYETGERSSFGVGYREGIGVFTGC